MFLVIVVHGFQNPAFARYTDNSGGNNSDYNAMGMQEGGTPTPNQENPLEEEEEIKTNVRSYVDSLLRINNHVEPAYKNPLTREEAKKQNIAEQISKLRKDMDSLQRALANNGYGGNLKLREQENETPKKTAAPKRRRRRHSNRSSGGYPRGIYTVKDVYRPGNSSYGYSSGERFFGDSNYKIKSYGSEGGGSCGEGRSCHESKSSKRDAKSGGYGEPAPFRSTPGCETGCGN
jgi:hypothetical protein